MLKCVDHLGLSMFMLYHKPWKGHDYEFKHVWSLGSFRCWVGSEVSAQLLMQINTQHTICTIYVWEDVYSCGKAFYANLVLVQVKHAGIACMGARLHVYSKTNNQWQDKDKIDKYMLLRWKHMSHEAEAAVNFLQYSNIANIYDGTLLKMGRYYNTTVCHYWDMLVK